MLMVRCMHNYDMYSGYIPAAIDSYFSAKRMSPFLACLSGYSISGICCSTHTVTGSIPTYRGKGAIALVLSFTTMPGKRPRRNALSRQNDTHPLRSTF